MKLTPSGYWDNGLWELSQQHVQLSSELLKQAVVEEVELKTVQGRQAAMRVTVLGNSWTIKYDKKLLKGK
jgi:hypothetical protein